MIYLFYLAQEKGMPINELYENKIKRIPTDEFNKLLDSESSISYHFNTSKEDKSRFDKMKKNNQFVIEHCSDPLTVQSESYLFGNDNASLKPNNFINICDSGKKLKSSFLKSQQNSSYEPIARGTPLMPKKLAFVSPLKLENVCFRLIL
jgi:hypothetical protein